MSKFKIQGVGVDTSKLSFLPDENNFSYIYTEIGVSNDLIVRDFLKLRRDYDTDTALITSISALDQCKTILMNHLRKIEWSNIDLLLVDPKADFAKYADQVNDILNSGLVGSLGLNKPESVEEIKKVTEIIKIMYISLDLCPLNFDVDIINYCKENNICIIGFNPFGGYINAANIISSFSVPYLLKFISNYCDIVMLSSRDLITSTEEAEFLMSLIDTESSPKYELKKTMKRLTKPLRKAINTSITIGDSIIPFDDPESIGDPGEIKIEFESSIEKLPEIKEEDLDDAEKQVKDFMTEFKFQEDATKETEKMYYLGDCILNLLRNIYMEEDNWGISYINFDKTSTIFTAFRKTIESNMFKRDKVTVEQNDYLLYYNSGNPVFRKIRFTEENN